MSKFTPGPWTVNTNVRYAINSKDKHIAMVSSYEMFESDRVENEANARLIAAAPDMLELLDRTIARLEQWDRDNICCDDDLYTDLINTVAEIKGE